MLLFLAASVLVWSADALLFPNNNGMEPEPELLFNCPPPSRPQFGSIKCDYGMFDMSCTAMCDAGFQFETGMNAASIKCDLFDGYSTSPVPKCVRVGGIPVTNAPVTAAPSTAGNCVRSFNDCMNKVPGDYAYCDNCRMFATCAASGFYVRQCPGLSVFDVATDRCTEQNAGSCKIIG